LPKRAAAAALASQGYDTKAGAEKGIESVKKNAPAAKVEDLTEREPGRGTPPPPKQSCLAEDGG
jgi:hypothetical protein